ncbi:MAG: RrF2 family transcriptional regulator [Candidatus Muiribacteriota bacterium]
MNLINFSESVAIAVHGIGVIAKNYPRKINSKQIAQEIGSYSNTVSKVFQKLARADVVGSTRGPNGGFYLVDGAENMSLLDIYIVIEGKGKNLSCPMSRTICPFSECVLGNTIPNLNKELENFLDSVKLKSLINKVS